MSRHDPTLPRFGTDLVQVRLLTFEASHEGGNELCVGEVNGKAQTSRIDVV